MRLSPSANASTVWKIFLVFLKLGCTSFGGPIAHLGYFRNEFVHRKEWLTERAYADLVALAQFLPGPTSSQVGLAIGLSRGGMSGAAAAWLGFTLPSAIAMILFGLSITLWSTALSHTALHALKIVAVAVVAQAVWGMAKTLCIGATRIAITIAAVCILLLWSNPWSQVLVIAFSALVGLLLIQSADNDQRDSLSISVSKRTGSILLGLFICLLIGLPILVQMGASQSVTVFSAFFQAGSMVFGGGHVILPLLQTAVVPTGWVSNDVFLAGYGAAQALPGPLFTFAAFLGAVMSVPPTGIMGAGLCLIAVFTSSFLLIPGVLPFWEDIRRKPRAQAALAGINAGVVGLLLAALYDPVWTSAIYSPLDVAWAVLAFVCLQLFRLPPWLVVLAACVVGVVTSF